MMLVLLLSCTQKAEKTYHDEDCKKYIAGKHGFWIRISSHVQSGADVQFRQGNRDLIPQKINKESISQTDYYLTDEIRLKDTLTIAKGKKSYNIYDFENVVETATDGSNHKTVGICRISTARIDGAVIKDSRNNILVINLK